MALANSKNMLPKDIAKTLRRMRKLFKNIQDYDETGDNWSDAGCEEYRELLRPMVRHFMPLVKLLCEAGLITMCFYDKTHRILKEFADIEVWPQEICADSNIKLAADPMGVRSVSERENLIGAMAHASSPSDN